jgi:hypothetical protein
MLRGAEHPCSRISSDVGVDGPIAVKVSSDASFGADLGRLRRCRWREPLAADAEDAPKIRDGGTTLDVANIELAASCSVTR